MFRSGGFVVHFFDRAFVGRLTAGFTVRDLIAFEEGRPAAPALAAHLRPRLDDIVSEPRQGPGRLPQRKSSQAPSSRTPV